ncbi:defensin alpha-like protein 1 [Mesocricetus auratus]|uniref:Defensin alpha-like protein 1 n=1 Tax=Mesocricetus auratus TaxID=10036 RepID=A0ABM2X5Y0_MESAU|nr:defensin alpha-like protein 1 [Mesocricetus auratus]
MKTLVLLSAHVLLAFQSLVDPLPEATEEAKNEEQPGVENQDVSISFGGPEGSVLQAQGFLELGQDLVCESLHLLLSVTGQGLSYDNEDTHQSDYKRWPVQTT